jgi:hypothetical protein
VIFLFSLYSHIYYFAYDTKINLFQAQHKIIMEFPIRIVIIMLLLVVAVVIFVLLMTKWGGEGATYVDAFVDFFKDFTPSFGATDEGSTGGESPQGLLPDLSDENGG